MSRTFLPVLFAVAALAACTETGGDQAATSPPDATPLLDADRAFAQLSADSGAVAAFRTYLADDAMQMPSGTAPITGRDSIVAAMAESPDVTLLWDPKHAEIAASGELGWTWGVYQAQFTSADGEAMTSAGKYLNVWRKQEDGAWRVIVDMGNPGV